MSIAPDLELLERAFVGDSPVTCEYSIAVPGNECLETPEWELLMRCAAEHTLVAMLCQGHKEELMALRLEHVSSVGESTCGKPVRVEMAYRL